MVNAVLLVCEQIRNGPYQYQFNIQEWNEKNGWIN